MAQYVLIFTLGPVQSFIAEARRTQDLYAGSHILSELSRAAVQAAGGKLVYPVPEMVSRSEASVPNKFVTIVDDPQEAARHAREAVKRRWQHSPDSFEQKALKSDRLLNVEDDQFTTIWNRQLAHHLEFYWAAAPIVNGDYMQAYGEAARALDARKRTRTFGQVKEEGLKDSLSGRRSALHTSQDRNARAYWSRILKVQRTRSALRKGERLDAIGALKRFGVEKGFPSVSTVASAPFARTCSQMLDELTQAIEAFNRSVRREFFYRVGDWHRGFEYDGDLLYEETYAPIRLGASYGEGDPTDVVTALRKLYGRAKQEDIRPNKPTPYYAILAMDGDRMGAHIAACQSREEHTELSRRQAQFAEKVAGSVQENQGYLVYAGGDDVLAFFPLKNALGGADALTRKYEEIFRGWEQRDTDGSPLSFTLSAGIAIAHHLHPLDAVLAAARDAEKKAKNRYSRNALCISVLKRSGEPVLVGSHWATEGQRIVKLVKNAVEDFIEERLASRFVYELGDQIQSLGRVEPLMVQPLLKRLLKRHRNPRAPLPETQLDALMAWAKAFKQGEAVADGAAGELARWLLLTRFIAQGGGE
jgi:CRISPR-associated protein Cmr2